MTHDQTPDTRRTAAGAAGSNQVLTFTLGEETYGVDILRVQEIRGWSPVTRIPQAPAHVLGVLNLRGSIVPIVDLRMRFNLRARGIHAAHGHHRVVGRVAAVGRRDFGVVVDGVSDVIDVAAGDVKPAPELGAAGQHGVHRGFGRGVGTHGDAARHRSTHRRGRHGCGVDARRGQWVRRGSG